MKAKPPSRTAAARNVSQRTAAPKAKGAPPLSAGRVAVPAATPGTPTE
jgi:hypothetical protein